MHKKIRLGEKEIEVKGSPLTLLFYKREFKTDLISDSIKYTSKLQKPEEWDGLVMLQIVWAMARSVDTAKAFPHFETWVGSLDTFNFADTDLLSEIVTAIDEAFFRSAEGTIQAK